MTPALGAHLRRATALSAAYARDPRALAAFTDLPPEALDGQVEEWRVRAALWNGSFAQGLAWMETMPATLATQPRWRYWRARAVDHTAGPEAAAGLYAPLAETAGMQRAHELFDCDMADEASAEWAQVLAGVDSKQKVQAAQLAAHWGWYAQAIATLAQSGEFDDVALRYPRPFLDSVENAAKLARLPADWIFGVMRQESLFRKDAVSHADARGLMQMLPSTAAAVARRWHLTPPGRDDLFDPAVAVPLGAIYLRELLDRYDNRLPLALAAYNAGSGAVERWLPSRSMDAAIWVENIPYNETRNYVQHILEHIVAFAAVRGAEPPSLTALLAEVGAAAPAL
jgi:soluble lytic murein transglycosylase